MVINLNEQQVELLKTLLEPIATDDNNSNFTRVVALQILKKLDEAYENR